MSFTTFANNNEMNYENNSGLAKLAYGVCHQNVSLNQDAADNSGIGFWK